MTDEQKPDASQPKKTGKTRQEQRESERKARIAFEATLEKNRLLAEAEKLVAKKTNKKAKKTRGAQKSVAKKKPKKPQTSKKPQRNSKSASSQQISLKKNPKNQVLPGHSHLLYSEECESDFASHDPMNGVGAPTVAEVHVIRRIVASSSASTSAATPTSSSPDSSSPDSNREPPEPFDPFEFPDDPLAGSPIDQSAKWVRPLDWTPSPIEYRMWTRWALGGNPIAITMDPDVNLLRYPESQVSRIIQAVEEHCRKLYPKSVAAVRNHVISSKLAMKAECSEQYQQSKLPKKSTIVDGHGYVTTKIEERTGDISYLKMCRDLDEDLLKLVGDSEAESGNGDKIVGSSRGMTRDQAFLEMLPKLRSRVGMLVDEVVNQNAGFAPESGSPEPSDQSGPPQ